MAEKWIKRHRHEERLIAYADTAQGHKGTIYRAANWRLIKEVQPQNWIKNTSKNQIRRRGIIGGKKLKFERCLL